MQQKNKKPLEKRKIVTHNQPCLNPKCQSSDARQVYEGGTSYCFSCSTFFPSEGKELVVAKKGPTVKTELTIDEVKEFPTKGFADRKISKVVADHYNIKVSLNEEGDVAEHFYPYGGAGGISGYKVRKLPKEFYSIGRLKGLFGQMFFNAGGKRLVITEGEVDALSVAQANYDEYKVIYPVIALRSSTSVKDLLDNRDYIRSFDEVVLMFDQDEAGKAALEEAIKIVGLDKVKIAKTGKYKDANELLVAEGPKALIKCVWDAQRYTPVGIVGKEEIWDQLVNYSELVGIPYPDCLQGVGSKLKYIRLGEIVTLISGTGCLGIDTGILMYDGSIKKVQDVAVGDVVMGDDNTPRNVLSLHRGTEQLYNIELKDGSSFVCNESHILTLVNNDSEGRWGLYKNQLIDVSVSEYNQWSNKRKHLSKAVKSSRLEFNTNVLELCPYVLGVWIGDGNSDSARFTCHPTNTAIMDRIDRLGYSVKKNKPRYSYSIPGALYQLLKKLNVLNNKHIPESYLTSSIHDRLQLFAGLLDTDGCYNYSKNMYEFSQKKLHIILQVKRLAESLGFSTKLGKQKNNKFGNCYRLHISGEGLEDIPCSVPYKQARARLQKKNPHRYSFKVTKLEVGDFYGFEVDGNGRYILDNFIITHNSGKSSIVREILLHLLEVAPKEDRIGGLFLEESPAEVARKLSGMYLQRNPDHEELTLDDLKPGFDAVFGSDRLILIDHQGSLEDDQLIEQLEYMCLSGCKYIFIDHITILASEGTEGLSENQAVDKIMNDLLRLAKRHNVWIGLVSHLRKAPNGKQSFEEGRIPSIDDIKGSGSIKQVSFDIIAFARNLIAESEEERNTIRMRVLKARRTGLTGDVAGARYCAETGRLTGMNTIVMEEGNSF